MKYLHLTIALIFAASISNAQSAAPKSYTKDFFQKLVQVYNTGDSVIYQNFYTQLTPDQQKAKANASQMLHEFQFTGKVQLKQVKNTSPTDVELLFQTDNYHSWWNYLWITDTANKFKEHHMRPVRLSGDFLSSGQLSQQQVLAGVNSYIKNLTDRKVFAGNVFIAKKGQILYNKSFGNDPQGQANSFQQQFDLASMGKLFTTVSILQLADQHKLSLNDSVGKLMPDLTNKALSAITVKQLLTHSSGMGDFFEDPAYEPQPGKMIPQVDFMTAIEKDKLHFNPGQGFRYSNTGFLLLGLIVEKVSGQKFDNYVQEHIFGKASMQHSKVGTPAGGGLSTVTDLYNFSKALNGGKLLSQATTTQFAHYHDANWGLGQEYQALGNEVVTGHSGGFIGVCTELNIYQKSGYTVIILSNTEPPYGHFLSDRIKELIIRKA
ncbi:hypothetical protein GCM10027037_10860 [Mucilaginibacter koreensis]